METQRMGERFSLIEPPQLPASPAKPNRPVILVLGAILSFAFGGGSIAVAEVLDDTIRGRKTIMRLLQVPPLGAIPVILTEKDRRRKSLKWIGILLSVLAVIAIALAVVNYFYEPLDVLWFTILNRIGLQYP